MGWLRKLFGLPPRHIHSWTKFGEATVPGQYRPAEGWLPAQRLLERTFYYRFCECGAREQYYPAHKGESQRLTETPRNRENCDGR